MALPVALAKFASFTDVFLSGLIIPLIPSIIQNRVQPPLEQVQILTSILISAYGGAIVAVSPLMPLLARRGASAWMVQASGLVCAVAAVAMLQLCSYLPLLVLARALQGVGSAVITGANSGLTATVSSTGARSTLSWISPALLQSFAMTAGPALSGYLFTSFAGEKAVFYGAYFLVAHNILLSIVGAKYTPTSSALPVVFLDDSEAVPAVQDYGTLSLRGGDIYGSVSTMGSGASTSTRRSRRSSVSSVFSSREEGPIFGIRMFTALHGYVVVGLLTTALYSVIPLFAERHLKSSMSTIGLVFVPLSGPAVLVGPFARLLTARMPKAARFLSAIGFIICAPGLAYLGHLEPDTESADIRLFATLASISVGIGLAADPLIQEITRLVVEMDTVLPQLDNVSATLPTVAFAWGSLIGPLLAGSIHWGWGWHTMTKFLGLLSAFTALLTLIFLQGWIGSPRPILSIDNGTSDETAPLLSRSGRNEPTPATAPKKLSYKDFPADTSEDLSSSVRTDNAPSGRRHRRHFSIDNFSIATTAFTAAASDPESVPTGQVRFQAALETPISMGSSFKSALGNPERRFVLREAPHAPATDPLLAAGNRYVIDDTTTAGSDSDKPKRHVVVFEEGSVPQELLDKRQHHVVAINSVDGSVRLASSMAEEHAVHVTEDETGPVDVEGELPDSFRRYVVVLLEEGDMKGADGGEGM
ncbi:major facilitator superfamily domain-containing protein [Podospora conica]|nr:major facilitator superfamily domain-containing protein [Schizothecium conicum]